jgi:hypothetical protein
MSEKKNSPRSSSDDPTKRTCKLNTDGCVAVQASLVVDFACPCCACGCFVFIVALLIATAMTGGGANLLTPDSGYEWTVHTEDGQKTLDMWNSAKDLVGSNDEVPQRTEMDDFSATQMLFSWRDGRSDSIMTAANIQTICQTEALVTQDPGWPSYCLLNPHNGTAAAESTFTCAPQAMSLTEKVYSLAGVHSDLVKNCTLLSQAEVDTAVAQMIAAVSGNDAVMKAYYGFFMASDAPTVGKTDRTRTLISGGGPLKGYTSTTDRQAEQMKDSKDFWVEVEKKLFKFLNMMVPDDLGGHTRGEQPPDVIKSILVDANYYYNIEAHVNALQVKFFNVMLWSYEWESLMYSDLGWVSVMMIYVFSYMCFHTGSFYLALLGFVQIIVSLPLSYIVYNGIFRIPLFTIANVLVIFVIMGIGADDLFVLVDGYKQGEGEMKIKVRKQLADRRAASLLGEEDGASNEADDAPTPFLKYFSKLKSAFLLGFDMPVENRNDAFKLQLALGIDRAMKSIFNTSFTTACAFLANLASPLAPLQAFGIFAAIVVIMNYLIVVMWTPSALVLYHKFMKFLPYCGCCVCSQLCCPADRYSVPPPPTWLPGCAAPNDTTGEPSSNSVKANNGASEIELAPSPFPVVAVVVGSADDETAAAAAAAAEVAPSSTNDVGGDDDKKDIDNGDDDEVDGTTPPPSSSAVELASPSGETEAEGEVDEADLVVGGQESKYGWIWEKYCTLYPRGPPSNLIGVPFREFEDENDGAEAPLIERFFGEIYTPLMLFPAIKLKPKVEGGPPRVIFLKLFAVLSILITVAYGSMSIYFASLLVTPVEEEKWFPERHMFATVMKDNDKYMQGSNDGFEQVFLVVGLSGINRDGFNSFDPGENRGTVEFDPAFSMATVNDQTWFVDSCKALEAQTCDSVGCQNGVLVVPGTVNCVLEDLRSWLEQSFSTPGELYADDPSKYVSAPGEFPLGTNVSAALTAYYAKNGTAKRQQLAGLVNGELRYVAIEARASLPRWTVQAKNQASQDQFDTFVRVRTAAAPDSAKSLIHVSYAWSQLIMQKALVTGMYNGLLITFPISFGVLLFATRNILVSGIGIFTIAIIVFNVLGFCQSIMGWYLGISESIAAVMIVGLSVDYVVHLAHMYLEAEGHGLYRFFWMKPHDGIVTAPNCRETRFRYAATKMGGTVIGGAGTTFGAGIIMFACVLLFFEKFAVLISITILFSLLNSLFLFMPLIAIIGPNGSFGDVLFLAKHLCCCCCCQPTFFACKKPKAFLLEATGCNLTSNAIISCEASIDDESSSHDDEVISKQVNANGDANDDVEAIIDDPRPE